MIESLSEEGVDIEEEKIKSKILRSGACPNNIRIYHTLTSKDEKYNTRGETIENFFGAGSVDRGTAGQLFEDWIDASCKAINHWLETGDESKLRDLDVPDRIKEYYLGRLDEIEDRASELGIPLDALEMDVQHSVGAVPFTEETPDGAWLLESIPDYPAGTFESKLAIPYEPAIRKELAGYAVHMERDHGIPVEFGVVQYIDEEDMEIKVKSYHIDNSIRESVRQNIQRFAQLVSTSKLEPEWNQSDVLIDRLVKPDVPDYDNPCRNCGYEWHCHLDSHIQTLSELDKSIKLGSKKLFPVLEAISEAEPRRNDVVRSVTEVFGGKSSKSVFRGMTQPTLQRLGLVRNDAKRGTFFLTPDARLTIITEVDRDERLGHFLRDFCAIDLNLHLEALEFLKSHREDLLNEYPELEERIDRFRNEYIEPYDVPLLSVTNISDSPIYDLYSNTEVEPYLTDPEQRRDLLYETFPTNQSVQMESVRWRLLRKIHSEGHIVTSWVIDELIWQEWRSHDSVLDLWEGSRGTPTQLIRDGTPYDNIILKGGR